MNRQSQLLTIAGVTALGGLLAYAVYFDYKRRNDTSFRKKLRSQKKKVNKAVAETKEKEITEAKASLEIPPEALKELHEAANKQDLPTATEARHQFFIETVSQAEGLLQGGPQFFLDAAILFYQAMRVYPSPMELITIYQKTVPEPILMVVLQLYNLDVSGQAQMMENIDLGVAMGMAGVDPLSRGPPSEASSQDWDNVTDPGSAGMTL